LCAWGRRLLLTKYDSKGNGLMRLAGHTWGHWPVSSPPARSLCLVIAERPALHSTASLGRATWTQRGKGSAFTHTTFSHTALSHTSLLHAFFSQAFRTQLFHTHTQLFHNFLTRNSFTHCSFTLTHNSFTYYMVKFAILHHVLCLSSLHRAASTPVCNYWKELTCGLSGPLILCLFYFISFFPHLPGEGC
jgi:hypothetical protein